MQTRLTRTEKRTEACPIEKPGAKTEESIVKSRLCGTSPGVLVKIRQGKRKCLQNERIAAGRRGNSSYRGLRTENAEEEETALIPWPTELIRSSPE